VTRIVDDRNRVKLEGVKPGEALDVQMSGDGKFILTRLEKAKRKVSYVRKSGLLLAVTDTPITWEETRKAMDEFP